MRMSCRGGCLGDAAGNGVQFNADEAHSFLALAHEIADAAAGFQDRGVIGHAQAGDGLMDGRNHGGRRVEGVEGGAFGAVVFLGRKQRLQFFAQGLPACILVSAGDRIGENRKGDRPEAGEAGERSASPPRVAGRFSSSICFKVRMAARMSRALDFSPLAMGAGCGCRVSTGSAGRDAMAVACRTAN